MKMSTVTLMLGAHFAGTYKVVATERCVEQGRSSNCAVSFLTITSHA